jgi:2-polyprenyl-3-methyl-5-hydroxy-6-metoxy-1,4-benzoquinol methylase
MILDGMTVISKVDRVLKDRWRYWCPSVSDRLETARRLSEFYATRADYHAMTAKPEKRDHFQVKLLLDHIKSSDTCVEFGCGGGVVLEAVAERAKRAVGMDIASLGLQKAIARSQDRKNTLCLQADAACAPLRNECADVVYCLEVLEHVWNPEVVLSEMVRVLRQGGLLFISTPNGFSLDLHLRLRWPIRAMNFLGAVSVYGRSMAERKTFRNTEPDLTTVPSYSDCDMIAKIFPRSLVKWMERNGCKVERMETYFFQQAKSASEDSRTRFSALTKHRFYRYFGDHILLLARKKDHCLQSTRALPD